MRKLILLLFLISIVSAADVDAHREISYTINENLEVSTTYTDYLYGNVEGTLLYIASFPTESDYIKTRVAPDFVLESFEVSSTLDYVKVTANGRYDSYVRREENNIHIGGRGFIDRTCKDYPYEILSPIKQTFRAEIKIPQSWTVLEIPAPAQTEGLIKFNYVTSASGNTMTEDVYFELTNTTSVTQYCNAREQVNNALTVGFTISENKDNPLILIIIPIFVVLMIVIAKFLYE